MIITSLKAKSFKRFFEVELADLPEEGLVGILGENESGKTSIGESICFALFGKTVGTIETDPAQVINWDSDTAEVDLEFMLNGGRKYRIHRIIDREGLHEARLWDPISGELIVEGPDAVEAELQKLIGIRFEEFRYTFYLAQKELDIVHEDKKADTRGIIYRMLGISAVELAEERTESKLDYLREEEDKLSRDFDLYTALADNLRVDYTKEERYEKSLSELDKKLKSAEVKMAELAQREKEIKEAMRHRERVLENYDELQSTLLHNHHASVIRNSYSEFLGIKESLTDKAKDLDIDIKNAESRVTQGEDTTDRLKDFNSSLKELKLFVDISVNAIKAELTPTMTTEGEEEETPKTRIDYLILADRKIRGLQKRRKRRLKLAILFLVLALIGLGGAGFLQLLYKGTFALNVWNLTITPWGIAMSSLGVGIVFSVLFIMFALLSRSVKKVRNNIREGRKSIQEEIDALREELRFSDGLDITNHRALLERLPMVKNPDIQARFQDLRDRFSDFLREEKPGFVIYEDEKEKLLSEKSELKSLMERFYEVKRLLKLVEGRVQEILANRPELVKALASAGKVELDDLGALEARIYKLIDDSSRSSFQLGLLQKKLGQVRDPRTLHKDLTDILGNLWGAEGKHSRREFYESSSHLGELISSYPMKSLEELTGILTEERSFIDQASRRIEEMRKEFRQTENELSSERGRLLSLENRKRALESEFQTYAVQLKRSREVERKLQELRGALDPLRHKIEVHKILRSLFSETARGIKERLGPNLSKYISYILPKITKGRYRKVRINEDLEVRVFSNDKGDFVRLEDLSGGSCDQILMSLRLGLSQALLMSKGLADRRHFLFFDEPVSSFDHARTRGFVEILDEYRKTFAQVFMVSHLEEIGEEFPVIVRTSLDKKDIFVSGTELEHGEPAELEVAASANAAEAGAGPGETGPSEAAPGAAGLGEAAPGEAAPGAADSGEGAVSGEGTETGAAASKSEAPAAAGLEQPGEPPVGEGNTELV
jgi:DNA repair exonuclease SbcCD ATPase subunit